MSEPDVFPPVPVRPLPALTGCVSCHSRLRQFRGMLADVQNAIEQLQAEAAAIRLVAAREMFNVRNALDCHSVLHAPVHEQAQGENADPWA